MMLVEHSIYFWCPNYTSKDHNQLIGHTHKTRSHSHELSAKRHQCDVPRQTGSDRGVKSDNFDGLLGICRKPRKKSNPQQHRSSPVGCKVTCGPKKGGKEGQQKNPAQGPTPCGVGRTMGGRRNEERKEEAPAPRKKKKEAWASKKIWGKSEPRRPDAAIQTPSLDTMW